MKPNSDPEGQIFLATPKSDDRFISSFVSTDTVELPLKVEKSWLHMDKVEYDKLEWMKDLPKPQAGDTKVKSTSAVLCP